MIRPGWVEPVLDMVKLEWIFKTITMSEKFLSVYTTYYVVPVIYMDLFRFLHC